MLESLFSLRSFLVAECREHRWIVPGLALTSAAALGSALPDLITLAQRVLS